MSSESHPSSEVGVERRMLEAVLDGDGQSWRTLSQSITGDRAFDVMGIATEAAVFRKWPKDPPLQEIVDYVTEIERRFPADLPVSRAAIETIIRGALGEHDLVRGTPAREVILAELLIVKSIQYDVLTDPADREAYLTEVLAAAG